MNSLELRAALSELELTQANFARLLGVTSRAVALWAANERTIPGPVEGYLRLVRNTAGASAADRTYAAHTKGDKYARRYFRR